MRAKTRRWIRRVLIGTSVVLVFGVGLTVYLLRRPPAVWTEAQQIIAQTTPEEQAELAAAVKQRLTMQIESAVGDPDEPGDPAEGQTPERATLRQSKAGKPKVAPPVDQTYELALTNDELVALVNDVFDDWTRQRGYEVPDQVTEPVVLAHKGRLAIAFEIDTPSWSQVFSGYVKLKFKPDGMAVGRVEELTAGSLPVSVVEVGEMLRDKLPESERELADRVGDWLAELDGFEFRPVLEMEKRRRARVVAAQVGDKGVTLTMRVQDHLTYKKHNALLKSGAVAVTDDLGRHVNPDTGLADVPTNTD